MISTNMENLTLRPLCEEDEGDVIAVLTNEPVKQTYMVPDFASYDESKRLFERLRLLSLDDAHFVRGICLHGRVIGIINDTEITCDSIELGWAVHPDYHSRGYATAAVRAAINELFGRGFLKVCAGAFEQNCASVRVMEKCGMQREDKTEQIEYRSRVHCCVFYSICKTV